MAGFADAVKTMAMTHQPTPSGQRGGYKEIEMQKMSSLLKRFGHDQEGVTALEYGIIAGVLGLVLVTIFTSFGTSLSTLFTSIATKM